MKFFEKLKAKKAVVAVLLAAIMIPMTMVVAFADDGGESFRIDYSSIFSEEMFTPLLEGIMSNLEVILEIGLGLLVIFLWIPLIPNFIHRFLFCRDMASKFGGSTLGYFKESFRVTDWKDFD